MRDLVGAAYWVLVGAPVVPALYFTLFYPGPAYLLLIPIAMGIVGVLLTGLRNVWALLIGFGGLPAAWLTFTLPQQASRMTWSCSSVSFEPSGAAYGYGGSGIEAVDLRIDPRTAHRSRSGVLGDHAHRALAVDRDAPPDRGRKSGCQPLRRCCERGGRVCELGLVLPTG